MWQGQIETFSDRYRIITWDIRGHGQSDSPEDVSLYSEAHSIADMRAILNECGVERAVVGGLSLGGYLSLAFHVAHPELVSALMLFDTGPGYKKDEARDGWNQMAVKRAVTLEERGLAALGSGNEVRIASHRSAQGLANAARGILTQVDDRIIQSLPEISISTLILVGENDKTSYRTI